MPSPKPEQSPEVKAGWEACLDASILGTGEVPPIPPPPPAPPKRRRYQQRDPAEILAQRLLDGLKSDPTLGGHKWHE